MILDAFATIAFTYPMATLIVQQPGQTSQVTSSGLGLAIDAAYGYRPDFLGTATVEMNLGVRSRNLLTWGVNFGAKYYLLGGLAVEERGKYLTSYSASKVSVYFSGALAQRTFNFPDAESNGRFIEDPTAPKLTRSGIFLGTAGGLGIETLVTDHLRLGLGTELLMAAFGADNIGITIFSGRFSAIYQP